MFRKGHATFLKGALTGASLLFVLSVGIFLFTKSPVPEVKQGYQWLDLPLEPKHSKRKSDTNQCIINSKHNVLLPGRRFLLIVLSHDDKSEQKAKRWCICRPWTRMIRVTSSVFFESIVYNDIMSILDAESTSSGAHHQPVDYVALASYRSVQMLPVEKLQALLHLLDASKVTITIHIFDRIQSLTTLQSNLETTGTPGRGPVDELWLSTHATGHSRTYRCIPSGMGHSFTLHGLFFGRHSICR